MRAARWGFGVAAIYGLAATLPLYARTPPVGAELWYWGFAGAAAATQLLYALIAWQPLRFRPAIPVGIASKASFGVPAIALWAQGRVSGGMLIAGLIDLALLAMFAGFFVALGRVEPG